MKKRDHEEIWFASFTSFVDDYKLRGQSPSSTEYGFFSTREKAEDFLCEHLWEKVKCGCCEENPDKALKWNYDALDEIVTEYLEKNPSEFIPCQKYQWEITNVLNEIDDKEVNKKNKN